MTRWNAWYADDNLARDPRILAAAPSASAEAAAIIFRDLARPRILDPACGIGRDTRYLEGRGLRVVGADAALNRLRVAQRIASARGAPIPWVAADAQRPPFHTAAFSGIYCFGLLHEFTGERRERQVAAVMREIHRVLGEDGVLVITALAGDPGAGLPEVQLYTRRMFEEATVGFRVREIAQIDDVGCTGRTDDRIWYGVFDRA